MEPHQHVILYATHSEGGLLLLCSKNCLCENNARTCVLNLLGGHSSLTYCHTHLMSDNISHELPYTLSM